MFMGILELAEEIDAEIERANLANGPGYASLHEAWAVMQEELDEVWEITKQKRRERDPAKLRAELIQCAATAIKAIASLERGKFTGERIP